MKNFLCLLLLFLTFLGCAPASGEQAVPCYWQLTSVEVTTSASSRYSTGAQTDILPLSGLDAAGMFHALSPSYGMSVRASRGVGSGVQGTYTFTGIPALAPGASSIRLTLASSMSSEDDAFYLYATVNLNGQRLLRVRESGVWMMRLSFPRVAEPGAQRRVRLRAVEISGVASVDATYTYEAVPGTMLIDANGDIVLYDLQGHETCRISTSEDSVPAFAASSGAEETLFSALVQADGSLLARFAPDCGLSIEEILQLLRTAAASARDLGGPSPLPSLQADADASALYIAAGTEITEENLAPLLGAALNQPAQTGEDAGILAVTASPTPLSYGELLSRLSSSDAPEATPSAAPTAASSLAEDIQALALYDEEGIRACVLLPGSQVDGAALETITGMLSRLGHYGLQEEELEALASQNPEAAQITLSPLGSATRLTLKAGSVHALCALLEDTLAAFMVTPTVAPTATPTAVPTATPTAVPTATPTAVPTATPTHTPTAAPTATPTATPTVAPTATPTAVPTATPTAAPTPVPTATPTAVPTATPTRIPTAAPTATPTAAPTVEPTASPTFNPTVSPAVTPTPSAPPVQETALPSEAPTASPVPAPYAGHYPVPILALVLLLILVVFVLLILVIRRTGRKQR